MAGGRQREFDRQAALDAAMHVFWKKGYIGASLTDLTAAMNINKPSMYATFGNKEELFIQSTHHYLEKYARPHIAYLYEDKPLKERLKNYLMSIIGGQCNEQGVKGCYVSTCVSEAAGDAFPDKAAELVTEISNFAERYLTDFFQQEVAKNRLPKETNSTNIARFVVTILHGTAAMARAGKKVDELETIIDRTITAVLFESQLFIDKNE